jgi:hypothetical protein
LLVDYICRSQILGYIPILGWGDANWKKLMHALEVIIL